MGISPLSFPCLCKGTGKESPVELWVQEEQCGLHPGCETLDQLYTFAMVLEGSWEFAQPVYMCFVDLEKAFDHRCPVGRFSGSMG